MTRVDFYVIEEATPRRHMVLVCRLAEKAWRQGHQVHIHCDDAAAAAELDGCLWTFKDISFIPHGGPDEAHEVPVTLAHGGAAPPANADLLINLGVEVPDFFSRFERVIETTGGDPTARRAARERYRFYRHRGYSLDSHTIAPGHV
jgi:DNA polymerase-3 subunit chi